MVETNVIENSIIQHADNAQKTIIDRLKNIKTAKKITNASITEASGIQRATLTRIFSGKAGLSVKQLDILCQILDVNISEITDERNAPLLDSQQGAKRYLEERDGNLKKFRGSLIEKYFCEEQLNISNYQNYFLFDPDNPAFHGITTQDDKPYYFYTKPTISNEKRGFLTGTLHLKHSGTTPPYCRAELEIEDLIDKIGDKYHKKDVNKSYVGEMIISLPMQTCYILLFSAELCEVSMMSFSHMYLNRKELSCRMCGVLTTSAGNQRRPVFEKAIISRTPLSEKDLENLDGQLRIGDADILVKKTDLDNFKDKELLYHVASEKQIDIGEYCEINEGLIRSSHLINADVKRRLINRLRSISHSGSYAKVSSRSDDILFETISDIEEGKQTNCSEIEDTRE